MNQKGRDVPASAILCQIELSVGLPQGFLAQLGQSLIHLKRVWRGSSATVVARLRPLRSEESDARRY